MTKQPKWRFPLLASGIGRHLNRGYGMVIISPLR